MDDLFLLVLAGHLLGDFVAQTDWQATNKEKSWRADLAHVLTYHVTMAVLVVPAWHDWGAVRFLAISVGTHALLDRRWPTKARPRSDRQQGLLHRLLGRDRGRSGLAPQHPRDQRPLAGAVARLIHFVAGAAAASAESGSAAPAVAWAAPRSSSAPSW
ncbi:MAG TPA: DUF3307 domain-containing protein [Actinomycetota bacterium]|jgi:hypothetical protein